MCKCPRKHAEVIKAWADGAQVQFRTNPIYPWADANYPEWNDTSEYRIKHEPKPDVVIRERMQYSVHSGMCFRSIGQTIEFTIDGENGKVKSIRIID